jgi:hypothetical protein
VEVLSATGTAEVRVTLKNGVRVVLRDPAVEGDSLVGWLSTPSPATGKPVRRAFAVAEVQEVSIRKNNVPANVVLGIVAGSALFFASVATVVAIVCWDNGCD